jgi:hypothetical protein
MPVGLPFSDSGEGEALNSESLQLASARSDAGEHMRSKRHTKNTIRGVGDGHSLLTTWKSVGQNGVRRNDEVAVEVTTEGKGVSCA